MKLFTLRLALFAVLLVVAAAWTKEDYEIFRLNDEVTTTEGHNITFYDFLGSHPSASQEEINKAYRKKSRLLHPDKVERSFVANASKDKSKSRKQKGGTNVNKGPSRREIEKVVKEATERSSRLNTVANILRGPSRERYDHFLKNGFPKWKGTGYYYSRYRPGLGSVLIGLFLVFGGAAHYAALVLSWKRQREFVDRYIRHARRAAWGDEIGVRGIPGIDSIAPASTPEGDSEAAAMPINRRQKRMMDRENKKEKKGPTRASSRNTSVTPAAPSTTEPTGERKRVVAENGKVLIVDSVGNVYLEEESEEGERQEFLLDIDEIHRPTFRDTMIFRFPGWFYGKAVRRILGNSEEVIDDDASEEEMPEAAAWAVPETTSASASNGGSSRRRGKKRSQRS